MELFDFPYHLWATEYPVSGAQITLGNSYEATIEPSAPDQRTFILTFPTMAYYRNTNGTLNLTKEPKINLALLDSFYQRHRLWKSFQYAHPAYGTLVVKFAQPLKIPQGIPGGGGTVTGFEVQLREQP